MSQKITTQEPSKVILQEESETTLYEPSKIDTHPQSLRSPPTETNKAKSQPKKTHKRKPETTGSNTKELEPGEVDIEEIFNMAASKTKQRPERYTQYIRTLKSVNPPFTCSTSLKKATDGKLKALGIPDTLLKTIRKVLIEIDEEKPESNVIPSEKQYSSKERSNEKPKSNKRVNEK